MKGETGGGHSQPQNHHLQQQPHIPYSGHGIVDSKKRRTEVLGMKGAQSRGLYDKLCVPALGERERQTASYRSGHPLCFPIPGPALPRYRPCLPLLSQAVPGQRDRPFPAAPKPGGMYLCSPLIPPHLSIFSYCRSYTGRFLRSVKRVRSQKQIGIELPSQ